MYSLDVNFLNDRPEYKPEVAARSRPRGSFAGAGDNRLPLYLGLLGLIVPLALVGGAWWYLLSRNDDLTQQQAALDSELGSLQAKQKQIADLQAKVKQVKDETDALASVFNTIKPLSAMMQEMRDRTPSNVQILGVKQIPPPTTNQPTPAPSPGASTLPPTGYLSITGRAATFNDVNDFLLVLQRSNFLKASETKVVKSELGEPSQPKSLQFEGESGSSFPTGYEPPKVPPQVTFEIQTALSDIPASDLLKELDQKGAAGLVTRIEELQKKGVIKQ